VGAQARSAHAEQRHARIATTPQLGRECLETRLVAALAVGHLEPVEPLRFVLARPERRIAGPQVPHLVAGLPVGQRGFHGGLERLGQRAVHVLDARPDRAGAFLLDGCDEFLERDLKLSDPLVEKLGGHDLERDPEPGQRGEDRPGFVEILFDGELRMAVVAERVEGRRRNGVDGAPPDERFDVEDVREVRILRARARPEEPLWMRALFRQCLPPRGTQPL
jgi:hypothetical protein